MSKIKLPTIIRFVTLSAILTSILSSCGGSSTTPVSSKNGTQQATSTISSSFAAQPTTMTVVSKNSSMNIHTRTRAS